MPSASSANMPEILLPLFDMQFDITRFAEDVCGVGARFEGELVPYARDLDVVG